MSDGDLNRRELFTAGGRVAAAGGVVWLAGAAPAGHAMAGHAVADPAGTGAAGGDHEVTVAEGTNIAASMSPDGRWVAMDLCAAIWVLPADGGAARKLTDDLQDATRPQFSPDSRRIVFQSYRDGHFHLWLIGVDGTGIRQLTGGRYDHREPRFSPDGTRIVFSSDRGSGYGIWVYDLASTEITPVADSDQDEAEPVWSADGGRIAFTVDGAAVDEVTWGGARRRLVEPVEGADVHAPFYGPGGTIGYARLLGPDFDLVLGEQAITSGEDVFPFGAQVLTGGRILYTADGAIRTRELGSGHGYDIPFTASLRYRTHVDRPATRDHDSLRPQPVRGIAGPVSSPDGTRVAFRALGALWVLPLDGGGPRKLVEDGFFNSDPDWFPDGRSLVYSSDRSGTPALWRCDLDTGEQTRLVEVPGVQLTSRCSPDGSRIAYQDEDGATWVLDLGGGTTRKVLPALFQPGRPSWSPDGRFLALAAVKPRSKRFREGTSQILTVDLVSGETRYTEPMPFASLSTRGDDGPVWSPDGRRMAFVVGSQLHVVDVDGRGRFVGEPVRITDEVTDAPSFCGGDLLYLNNGRLRLVPVEGGPPRTVEMNLTWTRSRPRGRTVLRAGAVWDGESERLRPDVDIVVEGDRIVAVEDQDPSRSDPVVDASGLTVMPGLIDAHNHWHLRGRLWGARQGRLWLSYGVTTTRSPGDPAYQMLETREALESGASLGPRYLATGEAVDGGRIYYNFMRPTLDERALARELDRADGLDYDLVKTYVRLPIALQRRAIESAGRPLTSHYLHPAVNLGMDGMEHTGATNRLGYSHTSSMLGHSYADAVELFVRSGMSITPTLFNSRALYATDRSLVDDPRTRALFPDVEYERLLAKAEEAGESTPHAEYTRRALAANVAMLLRIQRGGGFVISGTDSPLDDIAVSLHQNLRAMVQHGFTPHEALVTATANPARWLGLGDRLGAVRPGWLADLAVVEGDPLLDVRAAAAVRMVLVDGVLHRVDELVAPFSGSGATSARTATIAKPTASADETRFWWHGEPEWSLHLCC